MPLVTWAAVVVLVVTACSGGGDDDDDEGGEAVAGELVLGASADCLEDPACVPGLRDVYGVDLEEGFSALEPSAVVTSLESGAIDVGVMFSTDAALGDPDRALVVLDDDEGLRAADNIQPIGASELDDAYGDVLAEVVDAVSAPLTTDDVVAMNARHEIDGEDPEQVAADWLADQGLAEGGELDLEGPVITVGVQDIPESVVLSELYVQELEANGFETESRSVGGFSELVFGAFDNGSINFAVGYLATDLAALADDDVASNDVDENLDRFHEALADRDLVPYDISDAVSTEVFVMTSERAEELGITSLSDLD